MIPPDVTLFGHWICPYSVRVAFALAERRIPHDVVVVPPTPARPPGFIVPPEFVTHSPRGEIPMVRVGDRYRADSLPILEWLDACVTGRPLLPAEPARRALVRQRMAWLDGADWSAGDGPTLAEAVVVPLYGRLEALARLGVTGPVDPGIAGHVDRCAGLEGWAAVAWTETQTEELVGRSQRYRAKARSHRGG